MDQVRVRALVDLQDARDEVTTLRQEWDPGVVHLRSLCRPVLCGVVYQELQVSREEASALREELHRVVVERDEFRAGFEAAVEIGKTCF